MGTQPAFYAGIGIFVVEDPFKGHEKLLRSPFEIILARGF
jgi:hypothetical protein